ncbi:MAG TPA: RagB/SusD family nutrient uptake outer membrane protein [Bacteroidales bacterium]|nr:RagB/SusD family nutrient uptake outer membrane protein [Bacteroidales bacterium]
MKRYIVTTAILSVLVLSGCEKNFLERNPLDKISTSTFWKTKADYNMALTANYGFMHVLNHAPWENPTGHIWGVLLPLWDNMTDNSYGQHGWIGGTNSIVSGDISPSTGGYISQIWTVCYMGIGRTNLFLKQLNAYAGTDLSDAEKAIAEGEVRFFRAFYYFQLYSLYGDAPLVIEPLALETQEQPKVDADLIFNQVIADLDFAIANLKGVPYYENSGHVTISTAQALKARALMYTAYDETGAPDVAILSQVKALCLEIMPLYELSPVFEDLFQDAGQSGNPEIIFEVNYLAPDNMPTYGADILYGDWLVVSPIQNFIDAFECSDGLAWGVSPLTDPDNPFDNRDPRLNKTVFVDHPDWGNGNVHYPTNARPTGYGLKKFLEPGNIPYGYTTLSQQNTVVIRSGEVLLMYAEAQNEIAGPDETVYQAITDLRARVNMPAYPDGLTKEEMRERIRHERRIELAFEGLRYYDLKRWRIAGDVLNNVTDGLLNYHWEDRFYHWPIPQADIDKNHGTLIQNPDYQ